MLFQPYVSMRNMRIIEDVSNGMAELTGQYQNFSFLGKYLPWLWVFLTWCARCVRRCAFDRSYTACRVNVILIKIPFGFLRLLGPQLWRDVSRYGVLCTERMLRKHISL